MSRTEWIGSPNIVAGKNKTAEYTVKHDCFLSVSFKMDFGYVENPIKIYYAPPDSEDFQIVAFCGEITKEGDTALFYMPCKAGSRLYITSDAQFAYDDSNQSMEKDWYNLKNPIAWIEIY